MHIKRNRSKGIAINGVPIRKSMDLYGIINLVIFSPEDLRIIEKMMKLAGAKLTSAACSTLEVSRPAIGWLAMNSTPAGHIACTGSTRPVLTPETSVKTVSYTHLRRPDQRALL